MTGRFPQCTAAHLSGVMSLRKPQAESLRILEEITEKIPLGKGGDPADALRAVRAIRPSCTDFERAFPSLTFALATGVGKTRLMGAFIAFLHMRHGVRNFFVVAPGTTVYEKLKADLGDPGSAKYVFKGLACFAADPPLLASGDDYRDRPLPLYPDGGARIFIFNIDKFNKEDARMRAFNEIQGGSFYRTLAGLPDLVLIMDESHHYRAKRGAAALDGLRPVLGLELTATPLFTRGARQMPFKNVVYEYPLSRAIEDGYTRTPFAVTRTDISFCHFGDDQMDRLMLNDGILCHENAKARLRLYAENSGRPAVKPFMLVVCKDTGHAEKVLKYVQSEKFRGGAYRNKTIVLHSRQKGAESEENTRLLLGVERPDNPVEIVIHVNILKEGWDVNNLYTIVPLRTAASKVLREQMVGRGLRLPYGERTGDRDVDAVMLTAHDKFDEILREAQRGDSIFRSGNVIKAEEIASETMTLTATPLLPGFGRDVEDVLTRCGVPQTADSAELVRRVARKISDGIAKKLAEYPCRELDPEARGEIASSICDAMGGDPDLGDIYRANQDLFSQWLRRDIDDRVVKIESRSIPIPRLRITDSGPEEYAFDDFVLDTAPFSHRPIRNDLLAANLREQGDTRRIRGEAIDFDGYEPEREIIALLREKPEIDYEKCGALLFRLAGRACAHYRDGAGFGENGMRNIVMMHRREIADEIYSQMLRHFNTGSRLFREEITGADDCNLASSYRFQSRQGLFDNFSGGSIKTVLFEGIRKGVFEQAKFDSEPELRFARILESDPEVEKWLRPAKKQFDIFYGRERRRYEPDFVAETGEAVFLTEVKDEGHMDDPDVGAKREQAERYCRLATEWGRPLGRKAWRYLLISSQRIQSNVTFAFLRASALP